MVEGFKYTEAGLIPNDWDLRQLHEICSMKSGSSITAQMISELEAFPCYGGNGLRGYASKYTHNGEFSLIGRQGALCGNVQFVSGKFFASEHAVVVTPKQYTDIKWLSYILTRMNLNQYSESSAQPGLSVAKLLILPVSLPPTKAEQTAIATALNDADALIQKLEQLIAKKRNIKTGAMQELLRPKEGWEVKKLGECLMKKPDYGINAAAVPYNDSLPIYLRITDITEDGEYSKNNVVSVNNVSSSNYFLEEGDLVFARTGASVGKTYLYNPNDGKLVFAGFLIRVKVNPQSLNPIYFKFYTQTRLYWNWIRTNSMRTGQPGINGNEYQELEINLPPNIEEQTRIAQILSDMDYEIQELEKQLEKYKMLKQGMMQNLLTGKIRLI